MFDRVVCINLDRRPDRWQRFRDRMPADWPFAAPERFSAVDGRECEIPDWFRPLPAQRPGAWGCYQSHLTVWRDAMDACCESVLVFEDDAVLSRDFTAKALRFMDAVPADWNQLYFGGQHLDTSKHPPVSTDGICVRCFNVNRTHCYAMTAETMADAISLLSRPKQHPCKQHAHHIDHRLGGIHESGRWNVYAPYRFIVGQDAGPSDVGLKLKRPLFWAEHPVEGVPELPLCCDLSAA